MQIREAVPGDAGAIRLVHLAAFPTASEADLVDRLEADGDVLLSFVATVEGGVAGHVLLSRMEAYAEGEPLTAAALAPVAVLPDRQKAGIGSALTANAIARMRGRVNAIFVLGEPAYYRRFDFSVEAARPFESPTPALIGRHYSWIRPGSLTAMDRLGMSLRSAVLNDLDCAKHQGDRQGPGRLLPRLDPGNRM